MESKDWIKKFRSEKGLSQARLAKKMNVTKAYVYQYESGNRIPKPETLQRFADALEVPYYWLVVGPIEAQKTFEGFLSAMKEKEAEIKEVTQPGEEMRAANISLFGEMAKQLPKEAQIRIIKKKYDENDQEIELQDAIVIERHEDGVVRATHTTQSEIRKKEVSQMLDILNDDGIKEAHRQVELITQIPQYRKEDSSD